MAHVFKVSRESLKREYAVYVVIAQHRENYSLHVGKTGDNRDGCNPIISRCGNHFSYNKIHSQVRNKIPNHESCQFTCVFEHFGRYNENDTARVEKVDRINEMERWLNQLLQVKVESLPCCKVVNPYKGTGYVKKAEQEKRLFYRSAECKGKLEGIVCKVMNEIQS